MAAIFIASLDGRSLTFSIVNTPFLPLSRRPSSKLLLRNGISSPKLLSSTLSLHSSMAYALGNFGLVSTTECSDGSLVFHFGNVSEKERNAQVEESRVVHGAVQDSKVKVAGGIVKHDIEDGHAVQVPNVDHELEIIDEKTDSHHKRGKRSRPDQVLDIVNLRTVEKENNFAFACHTDDAKTNLHSNENSIENDQKQISSPVSTSECNDGVRVKGSRASVSKVSSEQINKIKDVAVMSDDVVIVENSTASVSVLSSGQSSRTKDLTVLSDGGGTVEKSRASASVVSSEQRSRNEDVTVSSDDGGRIENSKACVSEMSSEQTTKIDVSDLSIDGVIGENGTSSVSDVSSEQSNKTEDVTVSNIASMLYSIYDGAKVSSSFEDSPKTIDSETVIPSSSLETGIQTEVTNNNISKDCIEAIADSEVMHISMTADDHNEEVHGDAYKNNMMEEVPTLSLTEAELTMERATNNRVDESIAIDTTWSTEMNHVSVPSSTLREIDSHIEIGDTNQWSASSELQLIGTVSMREDISAKGFFLSSGAALLPQLSKALAGGEDAYFIICQNWLGVADGASSWSLEERREGLYAHELLRNCQKIVSESESPPVTNPVGIICRSAAQSQSPGLSTILVAYFDNQAEQILHVANIGDSGFILLRDGTVFQRSSPMFHDFNLPVQIKRGDDPSEFLEVYQVHLDEGDVLITATDGLFDNLYEQDIASIVSRSLQQNMQPQEIAEILARRAQLVGSSASVRSPFGDAAQAAGYTRYRGGKLDDVTVIVSLVQKKSV